ncbi:nucleotidyltransferase family protein [Vibrio lamellibrachiae]|uniref:nucleotidyltransferase family protein n=1 Tax=Vibrio lamellibrachiae TaxID=2910253 RepID=UPI003D12B1DC
METVVELVKQDKLRIEALKCVFQLNLPECYIAAGFVRNLVWDHLHQTPLATPLNDIDVIYFNPRELDTNTHILYEQRLKMMMPHVNWQVRNQAFMHKRNNDEPYLSSIDAMSYWPEKETAVGIRLLTSSQYECISAFGFDSLFDLKITHNPKRKLDIFEHRIKSKNWLVQWPNLNVVK